MGRFFFLPILACVAVAYPITITKLEMPQGIGQAIWEQYCIQSQDGNWCLNWKYNHNRKDTLVIWQYGKTKAYPVWINDQDTSKAEVSPYCSWMAQEKINCDYFKFGKRDSGGTVTIPDSGFHFQIDLKDLLDKVKAGASVYRPGQEAYAIGATGPAGVEVRFYGLQGRLVKQQSVKVATAGELQRMIRELDAGEYVYSVRGRDEYRVGLVVNGIRK